MTAVDSPEKILFTSTAQAFLLKEASLRHVRELHAAGASFDLSWWRRAAELGWTGLLVPEELGGGSASGDGVADLAGIAELLGKTVAPGPLYPVSTCLPALVDAPNPTPTLHLIDSLVSGETVASWAVSEPRPGWAPLQPTLTATPTDSGRRSYRIDGAKDRVEAGPQSAVLLVVARSDDGVRQFLVPTDAPGVTVAPQPSIDLVKHYARVDFDGVIVDGSAAVGTAAEAATLIDRQARSPRCCSAPRRSASWKPSSTSPFMGAGSAQLRPSPGVVSGTQTRVRRHEDVARGVPRHHRRRGRRRGRPRHPERACRPASPSPTSASWAARSCSVACRCTAASVSPGSMTCICI